MSEITKELFLNAYNNMQGHIENTDNLKNITQEIIDQNKQIFDQNKQISDQVGKALLALSILTEKYIELCDKVEKLEKK